MKKYLCLIFIPTCLVVCCNQPTATTVSVATDTVAIKKEITAFMDKYQSLARANDYAGIATLYDSSGAAFVNLEEVDYESYDTIKNSYARMGADTVKFFQWQEPVIIDPIKTDVATVSAGYHLYINRFIDTFKSRYSSVLVKTASGWKIKQENEMPEVLTAKKLAELWESKK